MGESGTTTIILFIAAVLVAGIAAGVLTSVVGSMSRELHYRGQGLADAVATDLAIVNDPNNVPYDNGQNELTLYVKNTGSATLVSEDLTVLVDGQAATFTTTLLEGASRWTTGVVAELTVSATLANGDHTAHVSYMPSVTDTLEFRT